MLSMGKLLAAIALAASFVQAPTAPLVHPRAASVRQLAVTAKTPRTLYEAPRGRIDAFAQDGRLLAWFASSTKSCNVVHVLSLDDGAQRELPNETSGAVNVTCGWDIAPPVGLALAGTDVLWTLHERLTPLPFDYVLGAGVSDTRERRFQEIAHSIHGAGLWLGGIAGDSKRRTQTLVYAVTAVGYVDELACLSRNSCEMKILGGGVYRVSGRHSLLIRGTVPAVAVAVAGPSVAYVPTATLGKDGEPLAGTGQPIEVRDTRDDTLISRVTPAGAPVAIALSGTVLATLEQTPLGLRLAWYAPDSGQALG